MKTELIKTKLALLRWQQNLTNLFTIVHLFGHKDEGGFDEPTMESVRLIIEIMQKEIRSTDRLLDNAVIDRSMALSDAPLSNASLSNALSPNSNVRQLHSV